MSLFVRKLYATQEAVDSELYDVPSISEKIASQNGGGDEKPFFVKAETTPDLAAILVACSINIELYKAIPYEIIEKKIKIKSELTIANSTNAAPRLFFLYLLNSFFIIIKNFPES